MKQQTILHSALHFQHAAGGKVGLTHVGKSPLLPGVYRTVLKEQGDQKECFHFHPLANLHPSIKIAKVSFFNLISHFCP